MLFSQLIAPYLGKEHFSTKVLGILRQFLISYETILIKKGFEPALYCKPMQDLIERIDLQLTQPYAFQPYHQRLKEPFDYHQFGIDFITPLIDLPQSTVSGIDQIKKIRDQLDRKENVILLANHQIEADPIVIDIMLSSLDKKLGEEMIFIAGERVIVDPFAVPFSLGCHLLCIYSKKYIDHPPELRLKKQMHNKKTLDLMGGMLSQGGRCIYVALSGGRDRRDPATQRVQVAPFDPSNLEMFQLMAKKSAVPTHFYPLSLATFRILPPPESTQIELGETRITEGGAVHLCFGEEIDFQNLDYPKHLDKFSLRQWKADYVYNIVKQNYLLFHVDY